MQAKSGNKLPTEKRFFQFASPDALRPIRSSEALCAYEDFRVEEGKCSRVFLLSGYQRCQIACLALNQHLAIATQLMNASLSESRLKSRMKSDFEAPLIARSGASTINAPFHLRLDNHKDSFLLSYVV